MKNVFFFFITAILCGTLVRCNNNAGNTTQGNNIDTITRNIVDTTPHIKFFNTKLGVDIDTFVENLKADSSIIYYDLHSTHNVIQEIHSNNRMSRFFYDYCNSRRTFEFRWNNQDYYALIWGNPIYALSFMLKTQGNCYEEGYDENYVPYDTIIGKKISQLYQELINFNDSALSNTQNIDSDYRREKVKGGYIHLMTRRVGAFAVKDVVIVDSAGYMSQGLVNKRETIFGPMNQVYKNDYVSFWMNSPWEINYKDSIIYAKHINIQGTIEFESKNFLRQIRKKFGRENRSYQVRLSNQDCYAKFWQTDSGNIYYIRSANVSGHYNQAFLFYSPTPLDNNYFQNPKY